MMNRFNSNEKRSVERKVNKRVVIIMVLLVLILFASFLTFTIISENKRIQDWRSYQQQANFVVTGVITDKSLHSKNYGSFTIKIDSAAGKIIEKPDFLKTVNDTVLELQYSYYNELARAHRITIDMQKDSLFAFNEFGNTTLKLSLAH